MGGEGGERETTRIPLPPEILSCSPPSPTMSPPPLPAIPPPQDPAKHFYLVYGANLHRTVSLPTSRTHQLTPRAAKLLSALLGPTPPLASYTVRVPSAFLSFDFAGIPFVEPCYTSAIVRGVNDRASSAEPGGSERGEEGVEYRRWVWERCCPGLEFTGELPPALEVRPLSSGRICGQERADSSQGVAYDLSSTHVAQVVASSEPLLPVDCTIFSNGDASISLGTLVAHTLVAPPEFRKKLLQPTARYALRSSQ